MRESKRDGDEAASAESARCTVGVSRRSSLTGRPKQRDIGIWAQTRPKEASRCGA